MTVCADIGILIFAPLQARHFERATALEIVWLSLIFMQAAFLLSWRARAKKDNFTVPANFYLWAVLLALATGAATSVIVMKVAQPSSYTDLANSSISLDDIQPVQKRLVIELLRKDIAATQANTASVKGMKPIDPGVYSPASLADVNAMQSTVEQLQKSIDIDANYNAQLKLASDEFRTKMMVADPTYLQGWDAQRKARTQLLQPPRKPNYFGGRVCRIFMPMLNCTLRT